MNVLNYKSRFWIYGLRPEGCEAWAYSLFTRRTKFLGIKGQIAPLNIDENGNIKKSMFQLVY